MIRPISLLLIDDDADDILLMQRALDASVMADASMTVLRDGVMFVEHLALQAAPRYDLILLDLNLPRMDGREALEKLSGGDASHHGPIVVLTTSADHCDKALCLQRGAVDFVTKPTSFREMISVLNGIAETHLG